MPRLTMNELIKKYGKNPDKQKKALSKEVESILAKVNEAKKLLVDVDKKCGDKLTRKKK